MPPSLVVGTLLSAVLHALWNLQAKQTPAKTAFLWVITLSGILVFTPLAVVVERQHWVNPLASMGFIAATIITHSAYFWLLAESYRRIDFTVAYPTARGFAQALLVVAGLLLLGERHSPFSAVGVLAILLGVQLLHSSPNTQPSAQTADTTQPTDPNNTSSALGRLLPHRYSWLPFAVGASIATYTLIDHVAVHTVPPISLYMGCSLGQCVLLAPASWRDYRALEPDQRRSLIKQGALFGTITAGGYILFLWVQKEGAGISYAAPIRETSILFGAIFAAIRKTERLTKRKAIAIIAMIIGVFFISFSKNG